MKLGGDQLEYPLAGYGITLKEIPNKVALFLEFGECRSGCKGCHSSYLMNECEHVDIEKILLIARESHELGANAVVLMGGTNNGISKKSLVFLIDELKKIFGNNIGLYSGTDSDNEYLMSSLRWLKVGSYVKSRGGLNNPLTNQRFYEIIDGVPHDKTYVFREDVAIV